MTNRTHGKDLILNSTTRIQRHAQFVAIGTGHGLGVTGER